MVEKKATLLMFQYIELSTYSIQSSVRSDLESLDSVLMQITCGPEIFFHKKLDYVWVLYYKLSDLISELVFFW